MHPGDGHEREQGRRCRREVCDEVGLHTLVHPKQSGLNPKVRDRGLVGGKQAAIPPALPVLRRPHVHTMRRHGSSAKASLMPSPHATSNP
eukprot:363620-Chlamydomonas_euryale.AAC.15